MLRATVYMHETFDTAMQKNIFFRIKCKMLFINVLLCVGRWGNNQ